MYDCIVIGGGIAGLMSARELAREGMSVALVEKDKAGRACSWAGGGILSPLYPWQELTGLTDMVHWGQDHYPALAAELLSSTGIDPEWIPSGLMIYNVPDKEAAQAWADKTGFRIEEGKARDSLWLPDIAQIRNPRLLAALTRYLVNSGVSVFEDTAVQQICFKNKEVSEIKTTGGEIKAGSVVIAAGAWSRNLVKDIRVKPLRGQMLCYQGIAGVTERILLDNDVYIIPRRDGHLLVGSTVEDAGFDESTTSGARSYLSAQAETMLPGISDYPLVRQWAGLRPATVTGYPYIGKYPGIKGLYLNTGHFRNGLLLAPGSARLLADIMAERQPVFPDPVFREQMKTLEPALLA